MSDNMWDELEDLLSEDTKESSDKSNSGDKDLAIQLEEKGYDWR